MSSQSFKVKNGLTLIPVSLSSLTSPQDGDLACDSSDNKIKRYSSALASWVEVGSASGSINFISNPDANSGTVGYATYKDAAGTTPVDGTGGTATHITFSTSSSNPLVGVNSFLITNSGVSSAQGEGVSYDFTVDSAYKAKVLNVSFKYLVNSGTFVAGSSSTNSDLVVYLYDVTNGVLIQPSTYKLYSNSSTISDEFRGSFQTSSNSTSYRLIFHVASTNTSAWSLKVDDIAVSPSNYVYGPPITDWQSYTPTTQGLGTITNVNTFWRRSGDSIEIIGKLTVGTVTASEMRINLPSGLTIDSTKAANLRVVGNFIKSNSHTTPFYTLATGGNAYLNFALTNSPIFTVQAASTMLATGETISFTALVPIQGWSSSVQMSDSADTRIATTKVYISSAASIGANSKIPFDRVVYDTTGSFNTSTNTYTVPVSGYYKVFGTLQTASSGSNIKVYKNGATWNDGPGNNYLMSLTAIQAGSIEGYCNAGDTLYIYSDSAFTIGNTNSFIVFERVTGPSAVAATETVAASYYASANASCISQSAANFDSRDYDTHSAVSVGANWKFTAPSAGIYEVSALLQVTNAGWFAIYKNGSAYKTFGYNPNQGAHAASIRLNAGDYIFITCTSTNTTITGGAIGTNTTGWINIKRVGL